MQLSTGNAALYRECIPLQNRANFNSRKQYKTQFKNWGLHKYRTSTRQQLSGVRVSNRDDVASGAASEMDSVTSGSQQQVLGSQTYRPSDASEPTSSYQFSYGQQSPTHQPWQSSPEGWLHNNQLGRPSSIIQSSGSGGHPYMNPLSQNPAITVRGVLGHCAEGLVRSTLYEEDLIEVERLMEFLSLAGSQQDAFKVAQALLLHIAAMPPYSGHLSTHLARVAVMMVTNARLLYNCEQILAFLNVTMYSDRPIRSKDGKHWPLLLSLFGLLIQGSAGTSAQDSLKFCCHAAKMLSRISSLDTFDWRYIVLITNCRQVSPIGNIQFDTTSAWHAYYNPRKHTAALKNIDGYIESLLMWCTAALDDANSWEEFDALSAHVWSLTSSPADVSELECKALFCYFYRCLQSESHVAPRSECHTLLREALAGLREHLHISTCEAIGTVSRILMRPQAQLQSDRERSNLVHRALSRMKEVRQLQSPLGILDALGWEGCFLSANFLDTLAQQYSNPYRLSGPRYESIVDEQIRDFLDRNMTLKFSMNAFMHNPMPQMPPLSGPDENTTTSLIGLINYELDMN
jgi:hypothetical protein